MPACLELERTGCFPDDLTPAVRAVRAGRALPSEEGHRLGYHMSCNSMLFKPCSNRVSILRVDMAAVGIPIPHESFLWLLSQIKLLDDGRTYCK